MLRAILVLTPVPPVSPDCVCPVHEENQPNSRGARVVGVPARHDEGTDKGPRSANRFGGTDPFGVSKTTINPYFDPNIDKTKFEGVRSISLDLLDERLTSLWIGFDETFKVQHCGRVCETDLAVVATAPVSGLRGDREDSNCAAPIFS